MNIAIIGNGRFGALLCSHLDRDNDVQVFDVAHDKSAVAKAELVIFAVPNRVLAEAVAEVQPHVRQQAVVMDVGSVKTIPCQILQDNFSSNVLGTHPLFGPDSAGESWQDHKMVFCKLNIADDRYAKVKELFTGRGVKAIECTPEEHDRMMAKTQALVHFIGRALDGSEPQEISTPDYANLLHMMEKVTNDTWELFVDMQNLNPYAAVERQQLLENLTILQNKIEETT